MNAAAMMESCPNEEVLAEFIDQRLDPASRLEVVKHLAECGECRDMVVAADEFQAAEGVETPKVAARMFRPSKWVPLVAAAVLAGVVFGAGPIRELIVGDPMDKLVAAANELPQRPISARLSGPFVYREYRANRSGANVEVNVSATDSAKLQAESAAWDAIARAEKKKTASSLHASGVAHMFLHEPAARDAAVQDLEKALLADPGSAAILNDLAAAYIARRAKGDYERAHAAASRAWSIEPTPAAAWNAALALQNVGNDAAAIAAWHKYLEVDRDPNSPWSKEVRERHLDLLTDH